MKAISLKQPWANLIAHHMKSIETRTWKTNYRGNLLICASKSIDTNFYNTTTLHSAPWNTHPRGVHICIVKLVNIRPMLILDEINACCKLYDGVWAWELQNIRKVHPHQVRGELKLFNVNDALIRLIKY